MGGELSPKINC